MAKAPLAATTTPQSAVVPLAAVRTMPIPLAVWPIPGDAPSIETIIADQSKTIAAQEALLHAYQLDLDADQNPPAVQTATGTGTATGTSLAITVATGTIRTGAVISGPGIPAAPPKASTTKWARSGLTKSSWKLRTTTSASLNSVTMKSTRCSPCGVPASPT